MGVRRCPISTLVLRLCEAIPKHTPLSHVIERYFVVEDESPRLLLTTMGLRVHANRAQVYMHQLLVARYMARSGVC